MPSASQRGSHPNHQFETPSVAVLWRLALIVLLAVAMGGCSDDDPAVEPRGMVDFIGEVDRVEFDPTWAMDRSENGGVGGGPDSGLTLGPQLIVLTNGEQLHVPADTPGGNYCTELYHPSLGPFGVDTRNQHCLIMGQRTTGGEVAWFEVINSETHEGRALADVGYVAAMDTAANTLMTTDGFEFVLVADESDCGRPLGAPAAMQALADWTTGEVVALICLFDG